MGEVSAPPNGQCPLPGPKAGTPRSHAVPGQSPDDGRQQNSSPKTATSQFLEAVSLLGSMAKGSAGCHQQTLTGACLR